MSRLGVCRGAHNPEVAGSNPAPATNVVESEALSHWERASCHVWPVTRSVTRAVVRDVSAVPFRLITGRIATGRDI
jgi:hypothetical protein